MASLWDTIKSGLGSVYNATATGQEMHKQKQQDALNKAYLDNLKFTQNRTTAQDAIANELRKRQIGIEDNAVQVGEAQDSKLAPPPTYSTVAAGGLDALGGIKPPVAPSKSDQAAANTQSSMAGSEAATNNAVNQSGGGNALVQSLLAKAPAPPAADQGLPQVFAGPPIQQPQTAIPQPSQPDFPTVSSPEDVSKVPSGSIVIGPDGKKYRKA